MANTSRTPIVAGNWKMNTDLAEGLALIDAVLPLIQPIAAVERVVCPPFVSLSAIRERLRGTGVRVGAQNAYVEDKGAFTGEVSPAMLRDVADYVIVGHSERRQLFGETDELVARKVRAIFAHGLLPILCVGETLAQRDAGETETVLRRQVRAALTGLDQLDGLVVAYEPVWAIGTGRAATAEDANAGNAVIRQEIAAVLGPNVAAATRIQYGGSVTADNAAELLALPEVDGALVGGASLKADAFAAIVRGAAGM